MSTKEAQFAGRYLAALRLHLQRPDRDGVSTALALGRSAVVAGCGARVVARAHGRALRQLAPSRYRGDDGGEILRHAEPFFLGTLAPIEKNQRAIRKSATQVRALEASLRRSASALATATHRLQIEAARSRRAEEKLAGNAQHYRLLLDRSGRLQDQLRHMARRVLSAQEQERKEISRELHDEIAQILAGINVQLAILKQASAVNNLGLRQRIALAQRYVQKSVKVVRRFARELRPALLDDLGLIPAVRSFMRTLPGRKHLRFRFTAEDAVEVLDIAKRTVLYRVAQEALLNVARHAGAKLASVELRKLPLAVQLEVHDDGRSFAVQRMMDSTTQKHLGLLGMRERVHMVGGTLTIESAPGKGTTVCAVVPLAQRRRTRSP